MANTLTNLIPDAISGMEIASRELIGFIPRVSRNAAAERTAKGTTVRSPVAPTQSASAVTPAATPPAIADNVYTNRTISMDNLYATRFHYTGEEQAGLKMSGAYPSLFAQNIAQAFRALSAEIETDLAELYYNASRAYGTAGTTPFASSLANLAALKKMLDDNGAPSGDRHLVIDTRAGYNLRQLTQLSNVNQSGNSSMLVEGSIMKLMGFEIGESDVVQLHTVGTSTGQDCTAIEPVGETTIAYDGGDGGTILVGDTISPASDVSNPDGAAAKYVVNTAVTAANGSIVINGPGLQDATASAEELTLGATNYRANCAFSRDFLSLATRPPLKPENGDAARDTQVITDPVSGLSFLLCEYPGYYANNYELAILWGVGKGNPRSGVILMG